MVAPAATDLIPVEINGVISEEINSVLQAQFPGLTMTPSSNFSFNWNGSILSYTQGDSQVVTPDLLAALTAAGAPFTQP